jgi:glyoxylase-like metal-dependent hydrolase (beta-lactamase superfamily II)
VGIEWRRIRQLVISHLHPDHFGLAAEIRGLSGAAVLMHRVEAARMLPAWRDRDAVARHWAWLAEHGVPPADSEEIAQTSHGVAEFIDAVEVDRELEDGDRLPLEEGELEVLWTPGHSPGLISLYLRERRLYFSSDHIIQKITPNIGLYGASAANPLADYLASLARVRELEIDLILPSHGRPFNGHREWIAATEEHHRGRCRRMLDAVSSAARTAYEVVGFEWGPHLSPLNERFAVAETLAHLEYMRQQGRVETWRENGLVYWRKA